jgi:hypothetical protein
MKAEAAMAGILSYCVARANHDRSRSAQEKSPRRTSAPIILAMLTIAELSTPVRTGYAPALMQRESTTS